MERPGKIKVGDAKKYFVGREDEQYIVEVRNLIISLRPKGSRSPDSEVQITPAQLYRHLMMARAAEETRSKRTRKKKVRRGVLAFD